MRYKDIDQSGFSLVELMIALTIGLIVTGAVAGIFIQSKDSYRQNDEINYIQDNGRYALNILASDLEVAGLYGGMAYPENITFDSAGIYLVSGKECGAATLTIGGVSSWTYDTRAPISYESAPSDATDFPCVSSFQAGTDILTIKRARGNPTTSLAKNTVYLYTDRSIGTFQTDAKSLPSGMRAWEYYVHLYYIDNDTLRKKYLTYDGSSAYFMDDTELAEGIEQFHILFGIDKTADSDDVPDFYTSSPTPAQLGNAVTARIYVLARSSKQITGYTNTKTYHLGDVTVKPKDGYYRRVYSTSVVLRNVIMLSKY